MIIVSTLVVLWITLLAHVRGEESCAGNYIIIVDESLSVSKSNFEKSYDFVINDLVDPVTGAIDSQSDIGALSFGYTHDFVYDIGGEQNDDRASLLTALVEEKNDYDMGGTNTRGALQYAVNMFANAGITTNKKIILLTDGVPCCTIKAYPCYDESLKTALADVDITLVMVGDFDKVRLSCLFEPGEANVIEIERDFDYEGVAQHIKDDACDATMLGVGCENDANCPCCMRCCRGDKVCEYPPARAESVLGSINEMNADMNGVSESKPVSYYAYILLVGVILFVLINNVFIGYWCVFNSNKDEQYEKCDVTIDE